MSRHLGGAARSILLVLLVASIFALAACWPSKERIGAAAERVANWWSPPAKRPIERRELGKAKRAFFDRINRSTAPAEPASPPSSAPAPR